MFKKHSQFSRLFILPILLLGFVNLGHLLGISNFPSLALSAPISSPVSGPIISSPVTPSPSPVISGPISVPVTPTPAPISSPIGDTQPQVALTFPFNNSIVTAGFLANMTASASSSLGVNRVVFHVNGLHQCTDYSWPYTCSFIPSGNGVIYELSAWVIDNGGSKNVDKIKVTSFELIPVSGPISAPVVDKTPPQISITSPLNGDGLMGTVSLQAQAADLESGVNRVIFHVDGAYLCTDSSAPYSCYWKVPSEGTHKITAWAIDNSGNKKSHSIQVLSQLPAKRVFVTSTSYSGNLGGLSGADAKCQSRADAASLGGSWKAWLSDSRTSATSRLNHSTLPFTLLNGVIIAYDWADLTDGLLVPKSSIPATGININEFGQTIYPAVRTGTQIDGSRVGSSNSLTCVDWMADYSLTSALIGLAGTTDYRWTSANAYSCSAQLALYCIEQ